MPQNPNIDYGKLVDEAMHIIVHRVLKTIQDQGLPGNHHFFISFATKYPGTQLSQSLMSKYPKEMTIVLQYQFQSLIVDDKGFEVTLSFNGAKERLYIPFKGIITFADPSVQFGLQFKDVDFGEYTDEDNLDLENTDAQKSSPAKKGKKPEPVTAKKSGKPSESNVISLDRFRKK